MTTLNKKLTIYLDVDDVILNTSPTIINLLNQYHNLHASISDLHDWGFRSIYPDITTEELSQLFESPPFWSNVQIRPEFAKINLSPFDIYLTTHNGSPTTRYQKAIKITPYFQEHYPNQYQFCWVPINTPKSVIDMSNGVQVDDNLNNLIPTNAAFKILLTNNLATNYNGQLIPSTLANFDNLYVVNTLEELSIVLTDIAQNPKEYNINV